jgi:hypothetical protein
MAQLTDVRTENDRQRLGRDIVADPRLTGHLHVNKGLKVTLGRCGPPGRLCGRLVLLEPAIGLRQQLNRTHGTATGSRADVNDRFFILRGSPTSPWPILLSSLDILELQ